jgi:hypothetical protein
VSEKKIGLREVRGLRPGQTIWDSAVAGFGARRQQSQAISYVLIYRTRFLPATQLMKSVTDQLLPCCGGAISASLGRLPAAKSW